jgi:hypothetical protein
MEKRYSKSNLPEKICAACGRPFAWRKKWARDWDNVKTCSERCKGDARRKTKPQADSAFSAEADSGSALKKRD